MIRDEIERQERALRIKHGPSFDPGQWELRIGLEGIVEMGRELGWGVSYPPAYRGFAIKAVAGMRRSCELALRAGLPAGQLPL